MVEMEVALGKPSPKPMTASPGGIRLSISQLGRRGPQNNVTMTRAKDVNRTTYFNRNTDPVENRLYLITFLLVNLSNRLIT